MRVTSGRKKAATRTNTRPPIASTTAGKSSWSHNWSRYPSRRSPLSAVSRKAHGRFPTRLAASSTAASAGRISPWSLSDFQQSAPLRTSSEHPAEASADPAGGMVFRQRPEHPGQRLARLGPPRQGPEDQRRVPAHQQAIEGGEEEPIDPGERSRSTSRSRRRADAAAAGTPRSNKTGRSGESTTTWLARMTKIVTAGRLDPEIAEDELEFGDDEVEDEAGNHLHHDQDQDQVGESAAAGSCGPCPRDLRAADASRSAPGKSPASPPTRMRSLASGGKMRGTTFRASGRGTPEFEQARPAYPPSGDTGPRTTRRTPRRPARAAPPARRRSPGRPAGRPAASPASATRMTTIPTNIAATSSEGPAGEEA